MKDMLNEKVSMDRNMILSPDHFAFSLNTSVMPYKAVCYLCEPLGNWRWYIMIAQGGKNI